MDIKFDIGDTIKVFQKIKEGEKTRLQAFEGIVIALNRTAKSYTVRKISDGVGVERIWAFDTPWIDHIDVVKKTSGVRKSKLYYLRNKTPKEVARIVA